MYQFEVERAVDELRGVQQTLTRMQRIGAVLSSTIEAFCGDAPKFDHEEAAYDYIPIDTACFLEILFELENVLECDPEYKHPDVKHRPCTFLEIGCGVGRNLFMLKHAEGFLFEKLAGFDVSQEYIDFAHEKFGLTKEAFVDDARTFDYGGYDVVYFYRPFRDDDAQIAFEEYLISRMKRGAYLVAFNHATLDDSRSLLKKSEMFNIWKRL